MTSMTKTEAFREITNLTTALKIPQPTWDGVLYFLTPKYGIYPNHALNGKVTTAYGNILHNLQVELQEKHGVVSHCWEVVHKIKGLPEPHLRSMGMLADLYNALDYGLKSEPLPSSIKQFFNATANAIVYYDYKGHFDPGAPGHKPLKL